MNDKIKVIGYIFVAIGGAIGAVASQVVIDRVTEKTVEADLASRNSEEES